MKVIFKNRSMLKDQSLSITYNHCILDIILSDEEFQFIPSNDNCEDILILLPLTEKECVEEYNDFKERVQEFLLKNKNIDYIYISENDFTKNMLNDIRKNDIYNFLAM